MLLLSERFIISLGDTNSFQGEPTDPLLRNQYLQEDSALPAPDAPPAYTLHQPVSYGQYRDCYAPQYEPHQAPPPYHQAPPPYPQALPPAYQSDFNPGLVVTEPHQDFSLPRAQQGDGSDFHMTLSIVLTVLCEITGGWLCLVCTVSAIILSESAKRDSLNGNITSATRKMKGVCCLNITAVIAYFVAALAVAIFLIARAAMAVPL